MLDVHQMHVFMVAAETLNFSRAAVRLHMTQPSVTQHIRALEDRFGKPLFLRTGHRLSLTEAGLALLPLARDLVSMSLRTEEVMESLKGEVQGHLVIGCTTTPGKYILPSLLASFLRQYPRVSATVQVTSRANALSRLAEGMYQVALSSVYEYDRQIEFHKFISEEIVLIVPPQHPWAARGEIELDELLEERFILREETSGTFAVVRDSLAKRGMMIDQIKRILTVGNSEAIAFAVQEGVGAAFVSRLVAQRFAVGKVALVKINGVEMHRDIYLLQHWQRSATSAQIAFWQYITDPDNDVRRSLIADVSNGAVVESV